MPDYESEVPHSLGDNRKKWHLDRSVPISALVAITLAVFSLVGTGIFWYTEVESRIESHEMGRISSLLERIVLNTRRGQNETNTP